MPKKLHSHISSPINQSASGLETLPEYVADGYVVMAIYTHDAQGDFMVDSYYVTEGHYEGRIAIPDQDLGWNVEGAQYWTGGDTGGFYYDVSSIPQEVEAEWHYFHFDN